MKLFRTRLELTNPWSKDKFKNLGCVSGRISKNLSWELEHTFYDGMLLDLDFEFTTKQDHAGLRFSLGIFGYSMGFNIYDVRHWNHEIKDWMNHD
jgi:hypothetical protein